MMAFIQRLPASGFSPKHGSTMWCGAGSGHFDVEGLNLASAVFCLLF
jgi:hypothetical protein